MSSGEVRKLESDKLQVLNWGVVTVNWVTRNLIIIVTMIQVKK